MNYLSNIHFKCTSKYLKPKEFSEFCKNLANNTLIFDKSDIFNKSTFTEENKEILTEDLKKLVNSDFNFYYRDENQKELHQKYIEVLNSLDYDNLTIVIDKISFGCGSLELEYRICTFKSYSVTDDINLIKLITANSDE